MKGVPYEKVFKGITLYHTLIYKIVLLFIYWHYIEIHDCHLPLKEKEL